MKIKFLKFLPIAAAVLLATSCSKDDGYERNVVVIKNSENNDEKKIETNDEKTPETIVVTGITLDKTALEITVGETATLTASVTPETATDKTVTWSSANESIATVDENGKVTAVAAGTVKITATAKDGSGVKGECEVTVKGINLSTIDADTEIPDGAIITGTLSGKYKITIASGATITLKNLKIEGTNDDDARWAGITRNGDATIILEGENMVKSFHSDYPGIYIAEGKNLTINGTGSLNASCKEYAAGIGGGYYISCGNITISGGTVTATGGYFAAGIGGGHRGSCGNITISGGTVTAKGGYRAPNNIGAGKEGTCGEITISDAATVTQN